MSNYVRKSYCEICLTTTIRLVTDHNHVTGLIRGTLCEVCNSHLGTFENNNTHVTKKYQKWFELYITAIIIYMQQDTGILYNKKKRKIKKQKFPRYNITITGSRLINEDSL